MFEYNNSITFSFTTDLNMINDEIKNEALAKIENILQSNCRSLKDYLPMPTPFKGSFNHLEDRLIAEELNFNREELK